MAPANGSSKARKGQAGAATTTDTARPAQKKTVAPALPLPYIKRQAASAAVKPSELRPASKNDAAATTPGANNVKAKPGVGEAAVQPHPKQDPVNSVNEKQCKLQ